MLPLMKGSTSMSALAQVNASEAFLMSLAQEIVKVCRQQPTDLASPSDLFAQGFLCCCAIEGHSVPGSKVEWKHQHTFC